MNKQPMFATKIPLKYFDLYCQLDDRNTALFSDSLTYTVHSKNLVSAFNSTKDLSQYLSQGYCGDRPNVHALMVYKENMQTPHRKALPQLRIVPRTFLL